MSDAPYIVEGEWVDREWMAAATKRDRTPLEAQIYAAGPKSHPWGPMAARHDHDDGTTLVFPSEDVRDAWRTGQKASEVDALVQAEEHPTAE